DDLSRLADGTQDRRHRPLCLQLRYRGVSGPPALARHPLVSAGGRRLLSAARPARSPCVLIRNFLERRPDMDFETYKSSLTAEAPPDGLTPAAEAFWVEAKGDL